MPDAISLMMDQIADEQRLPFAAQVPNAKTLQAMKELEAGNGQRLCENGNPVFEKHQKTLTEIGRWPIVTHR